MSYRNLKMNKERSRITETLSESLERKSMYLSNNELEEIVEEMNIETSIKDYEFSLKEQIRLCSIDLRMSNVIWYQKKLRWGKKLI